MKIALCQMSMDSAPSVNLEKSISALREAARNQAGLIVFPEVQLSPFFPQYPRGGAEPLCIRADSEAFLRIRQACAESGIMASPNFYFEEKGRAYDASFLIGSDGEVLGCQKMVHIAQAEQFYEQDYYTPSDDGFQVFSTPEGKIGVVVCFDRHYPESIRTEALRGADLILVPTANTKAEPLELFDWEIRVQAFQNSVPVVMCNRVGREGEMEFAGESLAVDAQGNLLAKADDIEQLLYAEIDLNQTAKIRAARPYTSLRRPEMYR